jgi:hypothetical protein
MPRRLYRSDSSDSNDYDLICSAQSYVPAIRRASHPLLPLLPPDKAAGGNWSISAYVSHLPGAEQAGVLIEPGGILKINQETMAQLPQFTGFLANDVVAWLDDFQSNDHIVQRYRR